MQALTPDGRKLRLGRMERDGTGWTAPVMRAYDWELTIMTAMPPEPDVPVQGFPGQDFPVQPFPVQPFPVQGDMGMGPGQFGSPPVQQAAVRQRPRWINVVRLITGVMWGVIAVILAVGGVLELTVHNVGGAVVCFVVGAGSGWYDYRVWKGRARRLLI
jgi:hypothetical protein